jgi:hypothetical protein
MDSIGMLRMKSERILDKDDKIACMLHQRTEGIYPRKVDQINVNPKGKCYLLVWQKIEQQILYG